MAQSFSCPYCKKSIELTDALSSQVKEQIQSEVTLKHKKELEEALLSSERSIRQKVEEENSLKIKDRDNEVNELKTQNKALGEQLLETNSLLRGLKENESHRELDTQKKIEAEKEKIREELSLKSLEEHRLKDLEKDKKMNDMARLIDELKRKQEQGSMQTQGEVLELDFEEMLKRSFPGDEIEPVAKGVTGADIRHTVRTPRGNIAGIILWEFKRTKAWSDDWTTKLKDDVRSEKAVLGALASQILPPATKHGIIYYQNIWVCNYQNVIPLATLLRKNLIDVATQRFLSKNKADMAQNLYDYITSHEFIQQLEAQFEIFADMNNQILRERIAFEKVWKQREGQVKRLLYSGANIIGGINGTGTNIPQIKGAEILEIDDGSLNTPDQKLSLPDKRNIKPGQTTRNSAPTLLDL